MKIHSGPHGMKMIPVSEINIQTERDNKKSNQMRCHQPSLHLGEKLRNLPRDDIVHLLGVVHPRQRLEPLQGAQRTERQVSWITGPDWRGRIYKQVYRIHKQGKMPQIPQKEFRLLTLVASRTTIIDQVYPKNTLSSQLLLNTEGWHS